MSKNKNISTVPDLTNELFDSPVMHNAVRAIENTAVHLGMGVMLAATVAGVLEIPERAGHYQAALPPGQHVQYAPAHSDSDLLRETTKGNREEVRHTSATYGRFVKLHAITGTA